MDYMVTDIKQQVGAYEGTKVNVTEQPKKVEEEAVRLEPAYDAVSTEGDTVSISEAGRAAEAHKAQPEASQIVSSSDGVVIQKSAEEPDTAAAVEEPVEEEEIISTANLSKYTKVELQEFYFDGDITKAEYDAEIGSREITG